MGSLLSRCSSRWLVAEDFWWDRECPAVGESPGETDSRSAGLHDINFPRITLPLFLNNKLRTYAHERMLFFIPTYLNF